MTKLACSKFPNIMAKNKLSMIILPRRTKIMKKHTALGETER